MLGPGPRLCGWEAAGLGAGAQARPESGAQRLPSCRGLTTGTAEPCSGDSGQVWLGLEIKTYHFVGGCDLGVKQAARLEDQPWVWGIPGEGGPAGLHGSCAAGGLPVACVQKEGLSIDPCGLGVSGCEYVCASRTEERGRGRRDRPPACLLEERLPGRHDGSARWEHHMQLLCHQIARILS